MIEVAGLALDPVSSALVGQLIRIADTRGVPILQRWVAKKDPSLAAIDRAARASWRAFEHTLQGDGLRLAESRRGHVRRALGTHLADVVDSSEVLLGSTAPLPPNLMVATEDALAPVTAEEFRHGSTIERTVDNAWRDAVDALTRTAGEQLRTLKAFTDRQEIRKLLAQIETGASATSAQLSAIGESVDVLVGRLDSVHDATERSVANAQSIAAHLGTLLERVEAYLDAQAAELQRRDAEARLANLSAELTHRRSMRHAFGEYSTRGLDGVRTTIVTELTAVFVRPAIEGWTRLDLRHNAVRVSLELALAQPGIVELFGEPGQGKSTLLRMVALALCRDSAAAAIYPELAESPTQWVVIYRDLGRSFGQRTDKPASFALRNLILEPGEPPLPHIADIRLEGRLVVLLDGFDEVFSRAVRQELATQLYQLSTNEGWRGVRFVVASRDHGRNELLRGRRARSMRIRPFGREQIEAYFTKMFATVPGDGLPNARARTLYTQLATMPRILAMAESPILCVLMFIVHQDGKGIMPGRPVRFVNEAMHLLTGNWEKQKGDRPLLDRDILRPLLEALAIRSLASHSDEFPDDQLKRWAMDALQTLDSENPEDIFERFRSLITDRIGLLVWIGVTEGENHEPCQTYRFLHPTLRDGLASRRILGLPAQIRARVMTRALLSGRWQHAVDLTVRMLSTDEAVALFTSLLSGDDPRALSCRVHALLAAARWLRESRTPQVDNALGIMEQVLEQALVEPGLAWQVLDVVQFLPWSPGLTTLLRGAVKHLPWPLDLWTQDLIEAHSTQGYSAADRRAAIETPSTAASDDAEVEWLVELLEASASDQVVAAAVDAFIEPFEGANEEPRDAALAAWQLLEARRTPANPGLRRAMVRLATWQPQGSLSPQDEHWLCEMAETDLADQAFSVLRNHSVRSDRARRLAARRVAAALKALPLDPDGELQEADMAALERAYSPLLYLGTLGDPDRYAATSIRRIMTPSLPTNMQWVVNMYLLGNASTASEVFHVLGSSVMAGPGLWMQRFVRRALDVAGDLSPVPRARLLDALEQGFADVEQLLAPFAVELKVLRHEVGDGVERWPRPFEARHRGSLRRSAKDSATS